MDLDLLVCYDALAGFDLGHVVVYGLLSIILEEHLAVTMRSNTMLSPSGYYRIMRALAVYAI